MVSQGLQTTLQCKTHSTSALCAHSTKTKLQGEQYNIILRRHAPTVVSTADIFTKNPSYTTYKLGKTQTACFG
jgi:hypothetical protein